MKEKLEYLNHLLELYKHKQEQREKRLNESKALSPKFDYLEVGWDGYLKKPYEISEGKTTRDKVLAAAHINGIEKTYKVEPGMAESQYYDGYKEVFDKVKEHMNGKEDENEKHSRR